VSPDDSTPSLPEPIGWAEMEVDQTIVLFLRAEGPGGIVGHGVLRYPRSHPQYAELLAHIGGLRPGQRRSVRPWPDRSI